MTPITVKLTAYNMGPNATEQDFDSWVAYVTANADDADGSVFGGDLCVSVESYPFSGGPANDGVRGARNDEERERILECLAILWERGCADGFQLTKTEIVHPLRVAVDKAEATLETTQAALDALENDSTSIEDHSAAVDQVALAEEALEAAKAALIDSDCPRDWELREEGHEYDTITAESAEEALAIAVDNCDRANYPESEGTLYIDVCVSCEETGENASETVTLEPEEPDCEDGETHDWQSPHCLVGGLTENPGVHGHGGGVLITEVCLVCGCKRVTDTWAQNPTTGEQGLREVTYEENAFTSDELDVAREEA